MLVLLFCSLLAGLAAAAPGNDTTKVCSYLYTKYPQYLAWDTQGPYANQSATNASIYDEINGVWWNKANSKLRSACAFFPANAEQVSDAVKELNKYPTVSFALKSGGHQPAPGFSATDGGVMISFEPNMNATVRSGDGKHFLVGPGARWGDVYNVTGRTDQVVVGGRLGHIGVGGFVLGGGLSYYSAQYGLACDNVDNFEAVLANGSIVNANRNSNPDLWWALRGGGNQFAIITQLTLQAHPAGSNGSVWGGIRSYHGSQRTQLFNAITNFIRDYPDAKAAVIPTFQFGLPGNLLNAIGGPTFFFFYDGATPPAGVFDEFDAIKAVSDDTGTKSYWELTNAAGGAKPMGFGASFREDTYPNMPTANMTDFYEVLYRAMYKQSLDNSLKGLDVQILGFDPQPMSVRIARASNAQGGNTLGLDPANGDRVWVENNMLWLNADCNDACPGYSKSVSDAVKAYHMQHYAGVKPSNYKSGDLDFVK